MTRFELATPATRTRCATKLRHIPTTIFNFQLSIEAQFGYSLLNGSIELSLSIRLPHSKRLSTFFHGRPCHIPTTIFNFQTFNRGAVWVFFAKRLHRAFALHSLLKNSQRLTFLNFVSKALVRFFHFAIRSPWRVSLRFTLRNFRLPHSKRLSTFFHGRPCHIPTTIVNFQLSIEAHDLRQKEVIKILPPKNIF